MTYMLDAPKFVRCSVSFASPTLKLSALKSVTVRHAPLTLIESPMWQSLRTGEAWEKVKVKPEEDEEGVMEDTWDTCSICGGGNDVWNKAR